MRPTANFTIGTPIGPCQNDAIPALHNAALHLGAALYAYQMRGRSHVSVIVRGDAYNCADHHSVRQLAARARYYLQVARAVRQS